MSVTDLKGKRITVIGGGVSGRSLAVLGQRLGAAVFLTEKNLLSAPCRTELEQRHIAFEENGHTERAWQADLVVASSGLSPKSLPVLEARERGIPVVGELDFVSPFLKGKILAVTGSNGKTTTTALMGHLLSHCGYKVKTVGNIGSPLAAAAFEEFDFLVAELSSFQLYWSQEYTVEVAVVTNLAPDHIDWHGTYENYVCSKASLLKRVKPGGYSIVQARDAESLGCHNRSITLNWALTEPSSLEQGIESLVLAADKACYLKTASEVCDLFDFDEVPLLGKHNIENAAMAFLACSLMGAPDAKLREALCSFHGLPHRCEPVTIRDGVRYVDDSKGTNVAATITALKSLPGEIVVILGGQGKGENYAPLAEAVKEHAWAAVLIGSEADRIQGGLASAGFQKIHRGADMADAVLTASRLARKGDTVLLSPACTSWDMYQNYKERGKHFQELARTIKL